MKLEHGYCTLFDNELRKTTACRVNDEGVVIMGYSSGWGIDEVFDNARITVISGPWEPPV